MKSFIFLLLMIGVNCAVYSQLNFQFDSSPNVIKGGVNLDNPWGGGLNFAQFSDFDFDFDGDLDLFVFDRSCDAIRVYTQESNGGPHYELAYGAETNFPPNLKYRTQLVDYDGDGKKDLFTQGLGGLTVYRNTGDAANGLQWELYQELIYTEYGSTGYSGLYVSSSDIPALVDVDADGDLDILTFHVGGAHVEYHQNQSMDLYGIPDSLIFIQKNECWGRFGEDPLSSAIILNDLTYPCTGGNISNPEHGGGVHASSLSKAHAGSTLLALDYNGSGVMDLILGDGSSSSMILLINGGVAVNTDSPMISADYSFPSNTTPVDVSLFPAAFYLDVDFDGIKDLIACPNVNNVSFNRRSVHFYKNIGTNSNLNFVFMTDNFLQEEMVEHGLGSIPILFDYNEDGLDDLLVANFYRYKPVQDKESTVAYYQNTGSAVNPVYTFNDDDVLNLAIENYGLRTVPAFGDLDNDGDEDLVLGIQDGTLIYKENLSVGAGAIFGNTIQNYPDINGTVISTGAYPFPQLFDLDEDGLLDLILGKNNGTVAYYKNVGSLTSPSFELINDSLGQIDVSFTPNGYATPHFFKIENEIVCVVGQLAGGISYYTDIAGNLNPGASFSNATHSLAQINVDAYSTCWIDDIDNDGDLNLFVGQDLGGIYHFENDSTATNSFQSELDIIDFKLYPNPAESQIALILSKNDSYSYEIFNLEGKQLIYGEFDGTTTLLEIDELSSGVYIIVLKSSGNMSLPKKLIKN